MGRAIGSKFQRVTLSWEDDGYGFLCSLLDGSTSFFRVKICFFLSRGRKGGNRGEFGPQKPWILCFCSVRKRNLLIKGVKYRAWFLGFVFQVAVHLCGAVCNGTDNGQRRDDLQRGQ